MIRYFVGKLVFKLINCKDYYLAKHINSKIIKNYGRLGIECKVSHPENIEIGSNSYVNGGYLIASKNAKIIIGKNCLLSYNIHLRTDMHKYENSNILINKQGTLEKDIFIGDDVWIGFGVQIMPGVNIASGCVIGAGAVVTKDTEPYSVYAGVPAQLIKRRANEGIGPS